MTYRITHLAIKRSLKNRFAWWLYDKWCREPYFPGGKIKALVNVGSPKCLGFDVRDNHIRLSFIPDKFVPGVHEVFIRDENVEFRNLGKVTP